MILNQPLDVLVLLFPALIFSLCVHECAHGFVAYYYGDETAYRMGRLTLNPLKHMDPIGTAMLLIAGFGYAKPVPVNPNNLKNPNKDMIKIAAAGPLSNFLLALIPCVVFKLIAFNMLPIAIIKFLLLFFTINIFLGIFNLLPIFPLDGGQIFNNVMYKRSPDAVQFLQTNGMYILLGIIIIGRISNFNFIFELSKPLIYFYAYVFNVPELMFIING